MLDAVFIKQCADPSMKPALVEQFINAAGSSDPLAISVKFDGRLILVPKASTPEEAMDIIRQNVGFALVRVGLTQLPAGLDVKDVSELKPSLVDACENLRMGTAMFAKVLRIVAKWYGNPKSAEVFPQIFDDAIDAWSTGEFEGEKVFRAEDPGGSPVDRSAPVPSDKKDDAEPASQEEAVEPLQQNIGRADMRVNLSRIEGN
jgi:hypothetical protein